MPKISVNLGNIVFLDRALDFIESYDFPTDLLIDVVRAPEHKEMDPSAVEKGYPVVRFRRGDITVVMGIRDPHEPAIIHVFLHTPDDGDYGGGSKKTGGASGKKAPTSKAALIKELQDMGCTVRHNGRGHYSVFWGEALLGSIAGTGNSRSLKNDYAFMKQRLASVQAQQYIRDTRKDS